MRAAPVRPSRSAIVWIVVWALWALPVVVGVVPVGIAARQLGVWLAIVLLIVVSHELGHAGVGRLLGYRIFELSVGVGRPLVDVGIGRTRVVLRPLPLAGHTMLAPRSSVLLPAREVFVALAGCAVNIFTVAWAWVTGLTGPFGSGLIVVGAVVTVGNLLPRRVRDPLGLIESDGLRAANALSDDPAVLEEALAGRYLGEAYVSRRRGDVVEALAWIERGLVEYPGNELLEGDAAMALIQLGRYADARARLSRLLSRVGLRVERRALFLNNLAWADLMLGDPALLPEAIASSKAAIDIAPTVPAFQGTRGYALIREGAVDEGILLCARALRSLVSADDRASVLCVMAIGAARAGRILAARERIGGALRLNPDDPLVGPAIEELERAIRAEGTA